MLKLSNLQNHIVFKRKNDIKKEIPLIKYMKGMSFIYKSFS